MTRAARATIDLGALRHNLQRVRHSASGSRVFAVVKADAYGHGMLRVARALAEADGFAVAALGEAELLRRAGVQAPILLLQGCQGACEWEHASHLKLDAVVHQCTQIEDLERLGPLEWPLRIWLKVDTGMHRLGFAPGLVQETQRRLERCTAVTRPLRFMTHLANADNPEDPKTLEQTAVFRSAVPSLHTECTIASSAGVLGWPDTHADWVRPGIMLYGVSPFITGTGPQFGLRPAMTLASRLIAVNHHAQGAAIGYGGRWVCPEDMPIGVVAAGYGDGYPRHAATGTPVLVNGHRVPLVGRVSMDLICVDLRRHPRARVGDPVVLWGDGLPVEEVALRAATIAYELLCGTAQRVQVAEN